MLFITVYFDCVVCECWWQMLIHIICAIIVSNVDSILMPYLFYLLYSNVKGLWLQWDWNVSWFESVVDFLVSLWNHTLHTWVMSAYTKCAINEHWLLKISSKLQRFSDKTVLKEFYYLRQEEVLWSVVFVGWLVNSYVRKHLASWRAGRRAGGCSGVYVHWGLRSQGAGITFWRGQFLRPGGGSI